MARILRRAVLVFLTSVFGLTVAIGLGVLIPRPILVSDEKPGDAVPGKGQTRRILILSNPIHTDIALPADPDVLQAFGFVSEGGLELDYPGVHWIVFGWGGRSFYIETPTWGHLRAGPVLDALTWDASVMHVRRAGAIPENLDTVLALDLEAASFKRLQEAISDSFLVEDDRPVPIIGAAYDDHDIFFPARGGFNAFSGCNTWTARMLREGGYQTGLWTPLPFGLTSSLTLHNAL